MRLNQEGACSTASKRPTSHQPYLISNRAPDTRAYRRLVPLVHHCRTALATPVRYATRVSQNAAFPKHAYVHGVREAQRNDTNLCDTSRIIGTNPHTAHSHCLTCPVRLCTSRGAIDLPSSSRLKRVAIGNAREVCYGIRQRSAAEPKALTELDSN